MLEKTGTKILETQTINQEKKDFFKTKDLKNQT